MLHRFLKSNQKQILSFFCLLLVSALGYRIYVFKNPPVEEGINTCGPWNVKDLPDLN
jgi:hypothetical protein